MDLFKLVECSECNGEGFINFEPCENCDEQKYIQVEAEDNDVVFVNVYLVTRRFGGHEEGGWYYDNYECVESYPTQLKDSRLVEEEAIKEYAIYKRGNISSVLGGVDVQVMIEDLPRKSETKEKPIYE